MTESFQKGNGLSSDVLETEFFRVNKRQLDSQDLF